MNTPRLLWLKLRSLCQRRAVKQEIDEELRFHLERRTEEHIAAGMAPEAAARAARKRFGNLQSVREECRAARGADLGEGLWQDLRFSGRVLAKSPGFVLVAVLMLAIGIGSVTAMFSVMRMLILKPYSCPNGDRMVYVWSGEGQTVSTLDFFDLGDQATSLAELGAYSIQHVNLGADHPVSVLGTTGTPGVLRSYGVSPLLGRLLEPGDEQPGSPAVTVISHRLWQESFGGDPQLIGRTICLDGESITVVGIMPANFSFFSPWIYPGVCDLWRPLKLPRNEPSREMGWWLVVGCRKEGVAFATAEAEIKAIGARLRAAHPLTNAKKPFLLTTLRYEMTRYARTDAWMIFCATLLLLLVACANIASMLLARGTRRSGEFGIRLALGATRWRILRLVFTESLLLSLAGAVAGAGVAAAGLHAFRLLPFEDAGLRTALVLDGYAFAFAVGLSLLTTLLAGLPSALAALRLQVGDLLRTDSRGAAGSGTRHRLLRGLIITQIALAFVLANVAVVFSASYAKLAQANAQVAADNVLSAELNFSGPRYAKNPVLARSCEQLAERVATVPGVIAAGFTSELPLEGGASASLLVNDEVFDPNADRTVAASFEITPGYLAAAGIPLLRGRTMQSGGTNGDEAVVNLALAERCWPGQDPLGKMLRPNATAAWFHARVVGVVGNIRRTAGETQPQPQIYWSEDHVWNKCPFLVVRSEGSGGALTAELRRVVAGFDPGLPLNRVRTFKALVHEATEDARILVWMTNYCMIVAMGLVAVGLYGTLSYHVLQRTREIGVRMALGATRADIVRLIFRQGFGWVLPGIALGAGGVFAAARVLRALVFDVNAVDPLWLAISAGAVAAAAVLACWFPARRAARTNPMDALRCE